MTPLFPFRHTAITTLLIVAAWAVWPTAMQPQVNVDAAFERFWSAASPKDAEKAIPAVIASGVTFDAALARLRAGRSYPRDVPTGLVHMRQRGRFPYTLEIPKDYSPDRQYQVRVQLHGGITRRRPATTTRGIGRLAGADQIYVLPAGWRRAMWWTEAQVDNIRGILDRLKRSYNVNENLIALSGVSDGAAGAYFLAMRDPMPYSSVLPLIGFSLVLRNPAVGVEGDLFLSNLRNRPFYVVNGGIDRLYPTTMVEPYVLDVAKRGVETVYRPQPEAGHDTSWWPTLKDEFEAFVATHPRDPVPDRLTWETSDIQRAGRLHWLVVDELGQVTSDAASMDDLNDFTPEPAIETGLRVNNHTVTQVVPDSNADRLGFKAGDVITRMDDQAIETGDDLLDALKSHELRAPVRWGITRGGRTLELAGRFAPVAIEFPTTPLFPRRHPSGRIDVTRIGNRIETTSRGVKTFTLLLSPDDFDFTQPVTVVTNGHVAFEERVVPDLSTLMRWAARDNDRTMLFGAEVTIRVR